MQVRTQFSVFLINRPGVLADVANALSDACVNLEALSLADSGEHGVLRFVCHDEDVARRVLDEAHDRWTETDVLVLDVPNTPGQFAGIARRLADANINISYAYMTAAAEGEPSKAVFKVADPAKAQDVLQK